MIIDDLNETFPFYEKPIREGLEAWLDTADQLQNESTRVPKRLLLPAMGLGALAALSVYHRLAKRGVGPLIVPDAVPSDDPLRAFNPATGAKAFGHLNQRLASILFAVHSVRECPRHVRALSDALKISPNRGSLLSVSPSASNLLVGVVTQLFRELPPCVEMTTADHKLFETRLIRMAGAMHEALERVDQLSLCPN